MVDVMVNENPDDFGKYYRKNQPILELFNSMYKYVEK
jgi:hypothetical protein